MTKAKEKHEERSPFGIPIVVDHTYQPHSFALLPFDRSTTRPGPAIPRTPEPVPDDQPEPIGMIGDGFMVSVVMVGLCALIALSLAGCAHRDVKPDPVDSFYRADAGVEMDPCGRVYP
jgi:hypothetical protein